MRTGPAIGISTLAAALAAGTACTLTDSPEWHDQLVADSPCYRVDLLDGLDETDTTELRETYACVNAHGHVSAYGPVIDALEARSRDGDPAGVEVARAVNALGRADVDVFCLAGVALDLLQAEDNPARRVLDLSIELTYAERALRVRQDVDLTDPDALEAGVWAPLAPVLPVVAEALLDDNLAAAGWAGDLIAHDETKRWVRTLADMADSPRSEVGAPTRALLAHAGLAMVAARDDGNDRWPDASGDSLRDVIEAFTLGVKGDTPVLDAISPEVALILGDATVRDELPEMLADLHDEGHLQRVPAQLEWLVSVDVDGGTLQTGELSALASLIRLLHATDRPMECSLDVGITDISIDLGNLAESMLDTLAGQDPALVQGGAGILGDVLDWGLTDAILRAMANSGACPALTSQVVDDLGALDLMSGPQAEDVLVLFVRTLKVLEEGDETRIPAFVDLTSDLHALGAVGPIEEFVRDTASSDLVADVVALVPVLERPSAYGVQAGSEAAPDLADALGAARWIFERDAGETGWQRVKPLVQAVMREEGTWTAMGNASGLLADSGSEMARLLELLGPVVEADEDLSLLDQMGALLADRDVAEPLLRVVETPGVVAAMLAVRPHADAPEVPLAFGARLVVGGALEDLLSIIDTVLGAI